jgi:hypothetical protein
MYPFNILLGVTSTTSKLLTSTFMYSFSRHLLIFFVGAALFIGCTESNRPENKQLNALLQENDSLITQIKLKNQELDDITTSMNQIENNLAAIRKNEIAIDSLRRMGGVKQEETINQLIKEIDRYVDDNRKRVSQLEAQMKNSKNESIGLSRLVDQQKQTVFAKEQQIQFLMSTITNLRQELLYTINTKNAEINTKQKLLEEKEAAINTVYYTFGNRDKLMEDGIIRKEGGVLGAGKSFKLASKFDVNYFKKANMKEINQVDLGIVDKKSVITAHPAESYYFIIDHQKFWSVSKYLVVETEGNL